VCSPSGASRPGERVGILGSNSPRWAEWAFAAWFAGAVVVPLPHPLRVTDLRTGDLGYLADGELFFTGRSKDVVVVMGRNHAAEELEWVAERTFGVRRGRTVAFGRTWRGREEAVIAVETADGCDPDAVARTIAEATFDALGFSPSEVLVVPKGTVQKTTSGKLRRSAIREADAHGTLPVIGRTRQAIKQPAFGPRGTPRC